MAITPRIDWTEIRATAMSPYCQVGSHSDAARRGAFLEKKCKRLREENKELKLWRENMEKLEIRCQGSGVNWCVWIRKGDNSGLAQLFDGDVVYIEKGDNDRGIKRVKVDKM